MTNRDYVKGKITCVCGTVMSFVWDITEDPDQEGDDALCPVCEKVLIRAPISFTINNGWHQLKDKEPAQGHTVWLHKTGITYPNVEYGIQANLWYTTEGVEELNPNDYWMPFNYPPGPGTPKKDFTG